MDQRVGKYRVAADQASGNLAKPASQAGLLLRFRVKVASPPLFTSSCLFPWSYYVCTIRTTVAGALQRARAGYSI